MWDQLILNNVEYQQITALFNQTLFPPFLNGKFYFEGVALSRLTYDGNFEVVFSEGFFNHLDQIAAPLFSKFKADLKKITQPSPEEIAKLGGFVFVYGDSNYYGRISSL